MATATTALAYLSGAPLQGSADAFVQASISTALSGQTNVCYRMKELVFELPQVANANACDYQVTFTRKSFAAIPAITEKSLIFTFRRSVAFATSGEAVYDRVFRFTWSDSDAPIIVEDPIYVQFDSATTSAANTLYWRIGYVIQSINATDRLQLIANSLS